MTKKAELLAAIAPAEEVVEIKGVKVKVRMAPRKYTFPAGAKVPAGGFLLLNETHFNAGGPTAFSLSALGDELYLFSGDGTNLTGYSHGVAFGAAANGGESVETDRVARVAQRLNAVLEDDLEGLLLLRKVEPTQPGFPRRPGMAKKRPLA